MPTIQEKPQRSQQRPRTFIPGLSANPETRAIQIGVICTVLIHLMLLWFGPKIKFSGDFKPGAFARPHTTASKFDIEISNDFPLIPAPKPVPPNKFVETNPESPENIPDETENFGAKNQQAAQPDPDKDSKLRTPKTVGPENIKNESQFQVGQLTPPVISTPVPESQEQKADPNEKDMQPKKEEVPLPGFSKHEGTNEETFGTNVVKIPAPTTRADKQTDGEKDARNPDGSKTIRTTKAQRPSPMPRPKLAQVRPGILQNRPQGTSNAGAIGVDAKFSQFGDYLQELIDIVQIQWERVLASSSVNPPSQSHVTIKFKISSRGEITEIVNVDENAGKQGTYACLNAIQARAPYRPWTKEMVAVLGEEQEITFNFMYW